MTDNATQEESTFLGRILRLPGDIILRGKIYIPKRWIEVTAYYVLPLVLLVIYVIPSVRGELQESLGTAAQLLLILILFAKPLSVLLKRIGLFRTILALRRPIGVSIFYLAFAHVLFYAAAVNQHLWQVVRNALQVEPLLYGTGAILVLFVLFLTSNNISTKTLKRWWKRLQRIAYVALPLVLLHASLMEGEGYQGPAVLTGVFAVLKLAEWYVMRARRRASSR